MGASGPKRRASGLDLTRLQNAESMQSQRIRALELVLGLCLFGKRRRLAIAQHQHPVRRVVMKLVASALVSVARCAMSARRSAGADSGVCWLTRPLHAAASSSSLLRPGECIINGECTLDPDGLNGVQDWEGYATHASGHLPVQCHARASDYHR